MKVYLHIGTHKTGSTLIQNICSELHPVLRERGLFYPIDEYSQAGHHELAWKLKSGDLESAQELYQAHKTAASDCEAIVLSSEEFEFVRDLPLLETLFRDDELHVITYLRRQDQYLESEYNQHVRMYQTRFSGDIFRFFMHHNFERRFNYRTLMVSWRDLKPVSSVSVKSYDEEKEQSSLVKSFFEWLNIPSDIYTGHESKSANVSLPPYALMYLARLNQETDVAEKEHSAFIRALEKDCWQNKILETLSPERRSATTNLLGHSYASKLLSRYKQSNNRVEVLFREKKPLFRKSPNKNIIPIDFCNDFDRDLYEEIKGVVKDDNS